MSFDWSGAWAVEATVPGGGGYRGRIDFAAFGAGWALAWTIDGGVGRYSGVGSSGGGGLFVSCGPDLAGLGLIVADEGAATSLCVDAAGRPVEAAFAATRVERGWRFAGGPASQAEIRPNGESALAAIRLADGTAEGLALERGGAVGLAWGPPLDRLVLLHYATPGAPNGPADAVWALGRRPDLADERLWRRR